MELDLGYFSKNVDAETAPENEWQQVHMDDLNQIPFEISNKDMPPF